MHIQSSRYFILFWVLGVVLVVVMAGFVLIHVRKSYTNKRAAYPARLPKENFVFPPSERFQYYYEPKPDTLWEDPREWLGYTPVYTINADGLNERYTYPLEKLEHSFRILVIGDSTTFGLLANTGDNYVERLEDLLNSQSCDAIDRFEVINLGVPGYDIAYTVERYKQKGQQYAPDLVLWLINDHNFYQSRERIIAREKELFHAMSSAEREKKERAGLLYQVSEQATEDIARQYPQEEIEALQATYIQEFLSLYTKTIVFLLFSDMPDEKLIALLQKYRTDRPNTWVYTGLPALSPRHGLLDDYHPSVEGHKVIATELYEYLHANGLYACN